LYTELIANYHTLFSAGKKYWIFFFFLSVKVVATESEIIKKEAFQEN
jgi:hypothetical protein